MERSAAIDKLIAHYSENFELSYDVDIAGLTVPAVASLRHRGEMSILGFSTGKEGPEACEHVFMLETGIFDDTLLKTITGLLQEAEREYVKPDKDHAYTFLSIVVIAGEIQKTTADMLRKFKYRRNYGKYGWVMSRVAVLHENGTSFCNKDGLDFKKLILKIINI